jgi:hypothetical protein
MVHTLTLTTTNYHDNSSEIEEGGEGRGILVKRFPSLPLKPCSACACANCLRELES